MEQLPLSVPGGYFLSDQGSPSTWWVASECVQAKQAAHGLAQGGGIQAWWGPTVRLGSFVPGLTSAAPSQVNLGAPLSPTLA